MRVKKVLSTAIAVAMVISTYTSVFAAGVSNSDISPIAVSDSDAAPVAVPKSDVKPNLPLDSDTASTAVSEPDVKSNSVSDSDAAPIAAQQETQIQAIAATKDVNGYTYEVTPLLSPFNEYFLVETDNPDPESFYFLDEDSPYINQTLSNPVSFISFDDELYSDVVYENQETKRVSGGYIFKSFDTDGGEVTLYTATSEKDSWGDPIYEDTDIKLTLPKLVDEADYLINTYAKGDTFFDKMDAVQRGLNSICLYSGAYIRREVYRANKYWYISTSPYTDQSFYLQSPYSRKGDTLFASRIYPFIRDSIGFPSIMGEISERLDSSSWWTRNSSIHSSIDVTYNGETRSYGGAGRGGGQGISEDKITRFYTFDKNDEKITLEGSKQLLEAYGKVEMTDDIPHDDDLTWGNVCDTVGNGSWVCVTGVASIFGVMYDCYSFLYKENDNNSFSGSSTDTGGSRYIDGSLGYASDVWVDGRYVNSYERYVKGASFEDHPESNIMLLQTNVPDIDYDYDYKYNDDTGHYEKIYKNVKVTENVGNITYRYNEDENTWEVYDYDTFAEIADQGLIDKKYLDMLQLTYDEVKALDVDRNTNITPDQGYMYNGSVEPGTKFDRSAINTADPSKLFADAKTLAEKNGLKFSLEDGYYGMCGESMYWAYLKDSGALIITGTGEMLFMEGIPWDSDDMPLKQLIIGDGVESIDGSPFRDCSELEKAILPNSLKNINDYTFEDCKNLASITVPSSLKSVGKYAFYNCEKLTTAMTLPNSVTSIGDYAFYGCSKLPSVKIPTSLKAIGDYVFEYCSSLPSINIPDSVTSIGKYAFAHCSSLASVTLPDSVTSIGDYAFEYCSSLPSINIPDSVTSIGKYAFFDCYHLSSITMPNSVTSIGDCTFYGCSSLPSINIPDSVTSIGKYAFSDCYNLSSITMSNSVTSIGKYAFFDCYHLSSITMPNSVTSIGEGAFHWCDNLKDIYYTGSKEEWQKIDGDFREDLENVTIHYNYVPGSEPEVKVGDINGDGKIDGKDSTLIARYLVGWNVTVDKSAADINKDGKIDGKDSTLLRRYIAGWDVELG